MNNQNGKGITVTGVEAEHFRRLRFARVELVPGKGLIRVTGANGSGKTTLLRMIRETLGGAGEVLPESINEDSEDGTGEVRIRLSNGFTVRRRYTESNPKGYLTVEGADGGKHGQTKLDEWLGPLSFDPLAWFSLKPDRQREILLGLGEDPDLPRKLEDVRARRKAKYDERTPWISQKRRANQVPQPEGERPEPVDVSAELRRMGELQKQERARQDEERRVQQLRTERQRNDEAQLAASNRITELEAELERAREKLASLQEEGSELDRRVTEAEGDLRVVGDPSDEMEEVRARIDQADRIQNELEPWKAYDRALSELAEATAAVDAITAEMDQLQQEEAELIKGAGIPVEGLSFDDDGEPLLNGRPLVVASGAERIQMAVAVAIAANPDIRVALVDEANDIGLEGLKELDALAKEHGFQLWACRLGLEGAGEVVIEDGVARDRDAEPAAIEVAS